MRECPDCSKQFSSDGSYRVHKFRFHKEPEPPVVTQEEPSNEPEPIVEPIKEPVEQREVERSTSDDGLAWLAGGAVVVVAILAIIFGKK